MKPLEHLLDPEFLDFDDIDAPTLMEAQANTAASHWTDEYAKTEVITDAQRDSARKAFAAVTNPNMTDDEKKAALASMNVPTAVKQFAGMLSQYDWEYVNQAKEIRGYVVANLLQESKHPDPRIRLRSLEMLGKLTEVGSFTERIEVKKVDATTDELTERIRSKLATLVPKVIEVQDATPKDHAT